MRARQLLPHHARHLVNKTTTYW
ncbi:putative inactive purple acid phosphatase 27 [Zea mays]|nr:putative inactive purple acid phosphatase 27 [Zea mays]